MTRIRFGLMGLVVAFTVEFGLASGAHGDPIRATYTTTGSIGTMGIVGTPNVSFQGVNNGSLTSEQPFSLGQFIATPQAGGATATYFTPFHVTLNVTSATGHPALPSATPITLDGSLVTNLNGGQAALQVYWNSTQPPPIGASILNAYTHWFTDAGSIAYGLYPTTPIVNLVPTSQDGGFSTYRPSWTPTARPSPRRWR